MERKFFKEWRFWIAIAFLAVNLLGLGLIFGWARQSALKDLLAAVGQISTPADTQGRKLDATLLQDKKEPQEVEKADKTVKEPDEIAALELSRVRVVTPSFADIQLELWFNHAVSIAEAESFIRVEPEIKLSFSQEWSANTLYCSGAFEPDKSYEVVIKKGFTANNGEKLATEVHRTVSLGNRYVGIMLAANGRYLAPHGKLLVPLVTMNVTQTVTRVARVLPQNLVQLSMREGNRYRGYYHSGAEVIGDELGEWLYTQTNQISVVINKESKLLFSLAKALPAHARRGVFALAVEADGLGGDNSSCEQLICVTDIGVSTRHNQNSITVWVTSLSTGRALADCDVQIYAPTGAELVRGKSSTQGIAELTIPAGKEAFMVAAQLADDATFLVLGDTEAESGRTFLKAHESEAFVMTDRGIYRHGERVFAQALLRDAQGASVPDMPVTFKVERNDGTLMASRALVSDDLGAVCMQLDVPQVWRSGRYKFSLAVPGRDGRELGQRSVLVESFVPPQIRVALQSVPEVATNGTPITFAVSAEHLFGTPAAGLSSTATLLLTAQPYNPKGWDGWIFGDNEKSCAPIRKELGKGELDASGKHEYSCELLFKGLPPAALKANLEGTVIEGGGRSLSASKSVLVHPYPFYIGIESGGKSFISALRDYEARFVVVTPAGIPLRSAPALEVRLERVSWITSIRRESDGRYNWVSERVKSVVKEGKGIVDGKWSFRPGSNGEYLLTVSEPASGSSTSWRFSAGEYDQTSVAWSYEKPESVEIVFDKPSYQPGEQARVQLRAPFAGTAWLTLQQDEIMVNHVFTMTNNTAELVVEVGQWAPNAEVSVSVIRPAVAEDVWRAHRAMGRAALCVQPAARVLKVLIDKPAAVCLPRGNLPVKVVVRDFTGQPVQDARVTLFAVDAGICMLTGHKVPDPVAWLFAVRTGSLVQEDIYDALMPISTERMWGGASHIGGDEGDELSKRLNPVASRRFKPLALCYENLAIDERGIATVDVELPEFAGELALMAVAWDRQATGSAQEAIKVRRNVVVQPDFPRVMAPGDQASAVVALYNESSAREPVALQVEVAGVAPLEAQLTQKVTLAQGTSTILTLPVKAGESVGAGAVRVRVSGGDSVPYDEEFELPVRPPQALHKVYEAKKVEPGQRLKFMPPTGMMESTMRREVVCSAMPAVNLLSALEYLQSYPYGCLEQTVSGVFPLVPLVKLAATMPTGESTLAQEAPQRIANAMHSICAMKREAGYAMWPDTVSVASYETVYTAHFIVEAKNAGYDIPDKEVKYAVEVVKNAFKRDVAEVYALCVLALANEPDHGRMLRFFEKSDSLNREERLQLARALAHAGEPQKARVVLEKVPVVDNLREAAFGLLAALEIEPDSPFVQQCVQKIESLRNQQMRWGTTQDNSLALLALAAWQLVEPRKGDGTLKATCVWEGGVVNSGVTNIFKYATGGTVPLEVANQGESPFYVMHCTTGVPLEPLPAVASDIKILREWLDLAGNPVKIDAIKRGDLLVVKLVVDLMEQEADDVIVEDLLPACFEIECADMRMSQALPWLEKPQKDWVLHKEARDDRMLLFSKKISRENIFYYSVRVVSAGEFVVPAVAASRMYAPQVVARGAQQRLSVAQ